jgi:uncharacterized protein with HEPN domain
MKKDPRVYLAQILERIDRILNYTAEGKEAFLGDPRTQDAVIRNFEVIGEAAKRIPEEYRKGQPAIPWRPLAAFRDVLIHQYEGVNAAEVWQIVERDLGPLRQAITAILPPLDELEKEIAEGEEPDGG